jgi:hypothetical protein
LGVLEILHAIAIVWQQRFRLTVVAVATLVDELED